MIKHTLSMSHMTTLSTVLCLRTSLAADPSPPPIMNTVFGLQLVSVDKSIIQYSFQMSPDSKDIVAS
jgi:hypothetical protein